MKVYAVTSGEYSDFGIEQLFSTKEKAEKFRDMLIEYGNDDTNERIDEYELDPSITFPRWKFKYWYMLYMLKDGNLYSRWSGDKPRPYKYGVDPTDDNTQLKSEFCLEKEENYMEKTTDIVLCAFVNANDEDHAIKIVNEKRTQLITNGKWIDDVNSIEKYKRIPV